MQEIQKQIYEADRVVNKCGYGDIYAIFTKDKNSNIGFHFDSECKYKSGEFLKSGEYVAADGLRKVVQAKYYPAVAA